MQRLSGREKLFCSYYCLLGSGREAAARAGLKNPEETAVKLLQKPAVTDEIAALRRTDMPAGGRERALAGLARLAFGSSADAVGLLLSDEKPDAAALSQMELFNIAEIKCPKAGGMEIKFFDRQRALERLLEQSDAADDTVLPFYEALEQGAMALCKTGRDRRLRLDEAARDGGRHG